MARIDFSELLAWSEREGLKPAQVARRLGVSSQVYNNWRARGYISSTASDLVADLIRGDDWVNPHRFGAVPKGFLVPRLNVSASMGTGAFLSDHVDIVERIAVNTAALSRQVTFTEKSNLRFISGYGDSMEGTFSDGDLLLVDTGVNEVRVDAVYVLELNDELYIKRLQRRPDGSVLMISDNRKYDPYLITNGEREKFAVRGRVLLAWNAKRL